MSAYKTFLFFALLSTTLLATPLHKAVEEVNEAEVHRLVEDGSDINALDQSGKTALHLATKIGRLSLVKYLVEHGADLYLKDKAHKSPLVYAIEKNHIKVIVYLTKQIRVKKTLENEDIFEAVKKGKVKEVKEYLKIVDLNTVDQDGKTLLHLACEYNQEAIVRMLLNLGIDKYRHDHDGRNALNYAKLSGNKKIIDLVQDSNATQ